jgi:hypothetical protein
MPTAEGMLLDQADQNPPDRGVKPLKEFNFAVVQEPLDGLSRNMDSDLQRRISQAQTANDFEEFRQLTLLLIMLRFVINSYQAIGFLLSDVDQHPRRLPRFVVVVPPINRQMMDLWFTLVYMMDDFGPRSLAYELCAWRELGEEVSKVRQQYGADPEWQHWFEDMQNLSDMMESQIPIAPAQKADPTLIKYWLGPFQLARQNTKSQTFMQFLERLVYHETSTEAHLKPAGLLTSAAIVLADVVPRNVREKVENRTIHQYKFMHLCRTVVTLLGIFSEIEMHCRLDNSEQLSKIWKRLSEYNADAKDVYEARYQSTLG